MLEKLDLYINERLKECEDLYNIKVLGWFFRNRGIFRKNSDLDIVFIFSNTKNEACRAIHDIIGYGFDFWGWCLDDVLKTLKISNEQYYENSIIKDFYLSKEHKRGGLGYYGGVFWMLGNSQIGGVDIFLSEGQEALQKIYEKRLVVEYLVGVLEGRIEATQYSGYMTSYMYSNSLWRILVAKNIMAGGKPGETDFRILLDSWVEDRKVKETIQMLLKVYAQSISKHSQRVSLPILDDFLKQEVEEIKKKSITIKPQNEAVYLQAIEVLKGVEFDLCGA